MASLHRAHAPEIYANASWRPEVDLITHTEDGLRYGPEAPAADLAAAFAAAGIAVAENSTYALHPKTQGYRFATAWPGRVLCFEVRRDLLVEAWTPFDEQRVDPAKIDRFASPLVGVVRRWLQTTLSGSRTRS